MNEARKYFNHTALIDGALVIVGGVGLGEFWLTGRTMSFVRLLLLLTTVFVLIPLERRRWLNETARIALLGFSVLCYALLIYFRYFVENQ